MPPSRRTIRGHPEKLREYDLIESADSVHRLTDPALEPTHGDIAKISIGYALAGLKIHEHIYTLYLPRI